MKPNKSKKIIIISIIVLVLLLVVGIVYAFVATDLMKSNKDLFFKYAMQLFDEKNGLLDDKLDKYNEKKKNSLYENYGTFKANINSENIDEETMKYVNDLNISFVGNIDNPNNRQEELIKINYSKDINFPITYKKVDDSYGIRLDKVVKQFLVLENKDLDKTLEKIGINGLGTIGDSIDTSALDTANLKFSEEELNKLRDVYLQDIKNTLEDSNFTKVKTSETEGYALEINTQKFKEILDKILDDLKNDEAMLNKISEIAGSTISIDDIEKIKSNLDSANMEDQKVIITLHQSKGEIQKLEIQINDEAKIKISKTSTSDELSYNIQFELSKDEQNVNASVDIKYTGLQNLEDVKENYTINLLDKYQYNIENEVKFIESAEIKDFTSKDALIINDMDQERLQTILGKIGEKLQEVNQSQMDELGIKVGNPLAYWIPIVDDSNHILEKAQKAKEQTEQAEQKEMESLEESEKFVFNAKFTNYEGDSVKGTDVKSLVMEIIANNMADEDKKIEVTGDIKIIGEEVPDTIETSKTYKVKCDKNEEGYINKIEITEN